MGRLWLARALQDTRFMTVPSNRGFLSPYCLMWMKQLYEMELDIKLWFIFVEHVATRRPRWIIGLHVWCSIGPMGLQFLRGGTRVNGTTRVDPRVASSTPGPPQRRRPHRSSTNTRPTTRRRSRTHRGPAA